MSSSQRSPKLTEAISATIVQQPFFAVLLLDLLEIVETDSTPTLATDSRKLYVNPEFLGKLDIQECIFCLAHEVCHVIFQHPERMRLYHAMGYGPDLLPFSSKRFNIAGDYVINAYLNELKVGKQPLNTLLNGQFSSVDLVDDVYLKVPEDEDKKNFDSHMPADPNATSHTKAGIQRAVAQAAASAKAQGKLPAGLQRLVDSISEPQVTWGDHLRATIVTMTGTDAQTWARPNRRRLAVPPHVYWPGKAGTKAGAVGIEIDTSGSIGDHELKCFLSELHGILTDVHPEVVYVGFVDAALFNDEIHEIHDVNEVLDLTQKAGGGGGTDMLVIFEELAKRALEVEMVVVFTDGYCNFGEDNGIPTVWCITTDVVAPWGTTVHVKVPAQQ